ncbi:catalase HPII [Caballeronia sp. dw_19]|uniref:catalase HPII n=1 Tax=Caballeronia sp. dw_19 TaxID=2719791 RepID=UPI001BD2E322|nr:catalase HPII [Caballeronia sp. dw_19]
MPTSKKNAGASAPSKNTSAVARTPSQNNTNPKLDSLEPFRSDATDQALTTNQGVKVSDNQNTLKAGPRGPSLLEDFIMREKITHFDHERIPERIVHARGSAAHGVFKPYKAHTDLTKAAFLLDPNKETPVYVRFSTVQGSRGSADTVRDVRGFAVKFYTEEGNFDLVGNNMPVFFIQDAIKFPDFVHAVKPEPHNEMPQGGSAHDTFWDFVSLVPESAHMVLWTMSDRAIPRSLRTMEGFGIHTFRLVNAEGKGRFVKFHWRPTIGSASLLWDEAQKLAGKDADFHRRDLWEAIDMGDYPEWELGVQIVEEDDEHSFDFDLLDPTKIIPEEIVPITMLGKLTLNRNPDNFFAETEQVAFCPGHIVPGIDFSNDPLLQGRLFSYTDTQISRLGGPNFHEIPINRTIAPMHNNQRDAKHRMTVNRGQASYEPNSIDSGWPKETEAAAIGGGFETYPERVDAVKIRQRSESFADHYSQATLFWNSMTKPEKDHIVGAYSFELSKVERKFIRERQLGILANIDSELCARVADNLGLPAPKASAGAEELGKSSLAESPALSIVAKTKPSVKTRKVAILAAKGADIATIKAIKDALTAEGAHAKVVAPQLGTLGDGVEVDATILGLPSIMFDGVVVAGGAASAKLLSESGDARHFVLESFKHLKAIGAVGDGEDVLAAAHLPTGDEGISVGSDANKVMKAFIAALSKHRVWARAEKAESVPA